MRRRVIKCGTGSRFEGEAESGGGAQEMEEEAMNGAGDPGLAYGAAVGFGGGGGLGHGRTGWQRRRVPRSATGRRAR
jgi:hypothetical protein